MKAAIIAAGLGERLQAAGIATPKPLVDVGGKPLIDHTLAAIAGAGIERVACIVNEIHRGIEEHCLRQWPALRFEFVRRTTPSSMESLFALAPLLHEPFVLLTVDAVLPRDLLRRFLESAATRTDADGVLALSSFVDDEKPLWATVDGGGVVTALGDAARGSGLITAGFYTFTPRIFAEIAAARASSFSALRQFLAHLLAVDCRIYGEPVGKTLDVDRVEDIAAAERFLAGLE